MHADLSIPLSKLFLSPLNHRQTRDELEVADLIPSIAEQGVLQQLVVVPADKGEKKSTFGVVAGGRRLLALQVLARDGKIAKNAPIQCLQIPRTEGLAASLAENTQRKQMHPADEFEAFRTLVDSGKSIEDVAACFGVTPLVVQRRLKLTSLSPRLIAEYRADRIHLDQLMALTLTEDHAAQERTWFETNSYDRDASTLRALLTQGEVRADQDRRARYLGIDAYLAAGGALRRDLFAEHDGYLLDVPLLESLVREKMILDTGHLSADGWTNVIFHTADASFYSHNDYIQLQPERREATKAELKKEKKIGVLIEAIDEEYQSLDDNADDYDDRAEALDKEREELVDRLEALQQSREEWSADQKAKACVVVSLSQEGTLKLHTGLVDRAQARTLARQSPETFAHGEAPAVRGVHSERLVMQLTAHRSAAMQATLAQDPRLALVALLQTLAPRALGSLFIRDPWLKVSPSPCSNRLQELAPDLGQFPAQQKLDEIGAAWAKTTGLDGDDGRDNDDSGSFLTWLLAQPMDELLRLLAYCVAVNADLTTQRETSKPAEAFAKAIGFDMRQWWTPTGPGYFAGVSKPAILSAVTQACGSVPAPFGAMKKDALVQAAAEAVVGKAWLPELLRDVD